MVNRTACITMEYLNGFDSIPLDQDTTRKMHQEYLARLQNSNTFKNYISSHYVSEKLVGETSVQVKVPTIIFHGTQDPIQGMGHILISIYLIS